VNSLYVVTEMSFSASFWTGHDQEGIHYLPRGTCLKHMFEDNSVQNCTIFFKKPVVLCTEGMWGKLVLLLAFMVSYTDRHRKLDKPWMKWFFFDG
jgi:hypothetical protein